MSMIRAARKRLTHELLLATARNLFESQGYAATTIDDIASGAGITRATLYLHFSSKAELLEQLVTGVEELFNAADHPPLEELARSGDPAVIRSWLDHKFEQWVDARPYLAMIAQSDSDPGISSIVDRGHDHAIAGMRAGLDAADRFDPATREIRCTVAFGGLETLSRRYIRAGGWGHLQRQAALDALTTAWTRLLADPNPPVAEPVARDSLADEQGAPGVGQHVQADVARHEPAELEPSP
jgi:AcrR family transcriptional regulator